MRSVVVGAGIGGLTAALALRQCNLEVVVLEQADQISEVGAGLQIGPNASRVLHRLGLQAELEGIALVVEESVRRRWETGEILTKTTLGAAATRKYGAPYLHLHRADLHRVLFDACVDPERPGPPVLMKVANRVVRADGLESDEAVVVTSDGTRYPCSLVVAADGLRSRLREIIGRPTDIEISGDMAYRTLLPGDVVRRDPVTRWIFDWPAANFWLGHDRHVVVYPVRHMTQVNVIAIAPVSDAVRADWHSESSAEEMRAHYVGWDERLTRLLATSDDRVMAWALNYQQPFEPWNEGRLALLGDACHAMLPYFSQGASQAIEDGAVLAEEVAATDDGGIPAALARYSARRAERAGVVQVAAAHNRTLFHLPDGPEQQARDTRFREHHQESDVSFDWIYQGTPLAEPVGTPTA